MGGVSFNKLHIENLHSFCTDTMSAILIWTQGLSRICLYIDQTAKRLSQLQLLFSNWQIVSRREWNMLMIQPKSVGLEVNSHTNY